MVRLRWWVVAVWLAMLLASLPLAPTATSALKAGFGEVESESRIGLRLLTDRLNLTESSITLVFSSDDLTAADPRYVEAVQETIEPIMGLPDVQRVLTFYDGGDRSMVAPDGRTTMRWSC